DIDTSVPPLLPSELDGFRQPPAGAPVVFVGVTGTNQLQLWNFHTDWTNPNNSSFTGPTTLITAPFERELCASARDKCIDQPGVAQKLDSLPGYTMYRAAYRSMGDHESLLLN